MENKLGKKVKDNVSGIEGIATCRCEYLNGCVQYSIMPKVKTGATEIPKEIWIDDKQLKVTGQGVVPVEKPQVKKETVGLQFSPSRRRGGGQRSHPNMQ